MLSQEAVLALFGASVTGAGLVLAAYTLIVSLSGRFIEYRGDIYNAQLSDLASKSQKSMYTMSRREIGEVQSSFNQVLKTETIPSYLRFGMGTTFTGYILSTIVSLILIVNSSLIGIDILLLLVFAITTIVFLIVGLLSIKDIHAIMVKDYSKILEDSNEELIRIIKKNVTSIEKKLGEQPQQKSNS